MAILFVLAILHSYLWQIAPFLFLCLIIVLFWLRPLPDWYGLAETNPDYADTFTIFALKQKEAELKKVRETKKWAGWMSEDGKWFTPSLPNEWQIKAAFLAPLAFEVFLIKDVWGAYGHQYEIWRYDHSEMKDMLLNAPEIEQKEETKILLN